MTISNSQNNLNIINPSNPEANNQAKQGSLILNSVIHIVSGLDLILPQKEVVSLQILTSSSLIPVINSDISNPKKLILPQREMEKNLAKSEFEIDKLWLNNENLNQKLMRNALENGAKLVFEKDINGTELPFVEFENAQDLYNFLDKLSKIEVFFHGSPFVIETLKPHKAKCSVKKEGNRNGIFFARRWAVPFFLCNLSQTRNKK